MKPVLRYAGILAAAFALGGCAAGGHPQDPFEKFNRAMFSFNDAIDQAALKPAATAYSDYLPVPLQNGIGNFFGNIGDAWTAANNLLQGKVEDGVIDIMRVGLNTTLGLFGFIDLGADLGMPKHRQDFGATLGVWGVRAGPYVVLPFLGSSTLRDTFALPVDFQGDFWQLTTPVKLRNSGTLVRVVDQRAAILNASNLVEDAALDRYEFIRDAYLQRRENKINSGRSEGSGKKDNDSSALPPQGGADVAVHNGTRAPAAKEPLNTASVQSTKLPAESFSGDRQGTPGVSAPNEKEVPAEPTAGLSAKQSAQPSNTAGPTGIAPDLPPVSSDSAIGQLTINME